RLRCKRAESFPQKTANTTSHRPTLTVIHGTAISGKRIPPLSPKAASLVHRIPDEVATRRNRQNPAGRPLGVIGTTPREGQTLWTRTHRIGPIIAPGGCERGKPDRFGKLFRLQPV